MLSLRSWNVGVLPVLSVLMSVDACMCWCWCGESLTPARRSGEERELGPLVPKR